MKPTFVWRTAWALVRIFSTVYFDLKAYGSRNVPREGGALLVCNHQSYIDPIVIGVPLRDRPISYMAKSELFENPVFNWLIRQCNAFPVRQGAGDVGAVKETIRRLGEGHLLNIFPEGARTETGELGPIERGAALVVRRANVPIIPVVVDGAFDAWPKGRTLPRSRPIRVLYGKPIDVSGLKAEAIVQLIDRTFRQMLGELRARRAREQSTDIDLRSLAAAAGRRTS